MEMFGVMCNFLILFRGSDCTSSSSLITYAVCYVFQLYIIPTFKIETMNENDICVNFSFHLELFFLFHFRSFHYYVIRSTLFKPRREKTGFCICENKDADQLRGDAVSAFVFATWIVQSLCFLNPKFQVSNHLLWLYSPVCVGSGRKPRRPVF